MRMYIYTIIYIYDIFIWYIYIYVWYIYIYVWYIYMYDIYIYIYMYDIYIYMYIDVYIYIYVYIYLSIYLYIYIELYLYKIRRTSGPPGRSRRPRERRRAAGLRPAAAEARLRGRRGLRPAELLLQPLDSWRWLRWRIRWYDEVIVMMEFLMVYIYILYGE